MPRLPPQSHLDEPLPNTYWVVPRRILASEYPCGANESDTRDRLDRLYEAGVNYIIDLTEPGEMPDYRRLLPKHTHHLRHAIADTRAPDDPVYMQALQARIGNALALNRRIYIHCQRASARATSALSGRAERRFWWILILPMFALAAGAVLVIALPASLVARFLPATMRAEDFSGRVWRGSAGRIAIRVRAHIFLCMLAYYVEWRLIEAWHALMFTDEDQAAKATRDPVAPAKRSATGLEKVATHTLEDGTPAHSLRTLFAELAALVRNTCRTTDHPATFDILTNPTPLQRRAFAMVDQIILQSVSTHSKIVYVVVAKTKIRASTPGT